MKNLFAREPVMVIQAVAQAATAAILALVDAGLVTYGVVAPAIAILAALAGRQKVTPVEV